MINDMQQITANGILIWVAWGFFMGFGWNVAGYLFGWLPRRA